MDLNKTFCLLIHAGAILIFCMNFFFSTYQSAVIPTTSANQTDRIALLAFKDRITNNPFGALSSWNDSSHFCTWTGIVCSRRHHQRVTVVNLESKRLVGSISPYIGNLTFLKYLNLGSNSFNAEVPDEIGRLFRLQRLNLSLNLLQGQIPINLTYFSKLTYLNLVLNQLQGIIPPELGSLSSLTKLLLGGNPLTAQTIPVSLSNLSALTDLSLRENNLIGNIPLELGRLSKLEFFQVSFNNLSGTIPVQLYNISSISIFAASGNQFHGPIPLNIGLTLPNLQYLYLALNKFSGSLPNSILNASTLVALDLSSNQFTGRIPPDLGVLQSIVWLNFWGNQLGADKSDDLIFLNSLTNCSHLERISLSDNNLIGQLPNSIANLSTKLTGFLISENLISGEIPVGISHSVRHDSKKNALRV